MKSKSILFLLSGLAIGAVAGILMAPEKKMKHGKKQSKKVRKAFKEAASKYKEKLEGMGEGLEAKVRDI